MVQRRDGHSVRFTTPRLVVAGLSGDSGKTLVALGVAAALKARGVDVAPFKKGPDYIDAAWLGAATGRPGRNLDTFFHGPEALGEALSRASGGESAGLALIEGNRGLFDGFDAAGTHSTAELAKRLRAPVLLVVDVTKTTRTVAAMVLGCRTLDPDVPLAGVVLNRVATSRQEGVIREALARAGGPPVLGAIPRLDDDPLPGRHLGLVTAAEHPRTQEAVNTAARLVEAHVDLEMIEKVAGGAPPIEFPDRQRPTSGPRVRIGVLRDEAFSFYYPENLEALEERGAELAFFSALAGDALPEVDALYVGGGFPELYAGRLSENRVLRRTLPAAVAAGMPVYAECGGLMYLAKELITDGVSHPMAGVLDLVVEQTSRPRGHGYAEGTVERPNPFFEKGTRLRGHEFHYSQVRGGEHRSASVVGLDRGPGLGDGRDGIVVGRVWASYLHLHALGTPEWAAGLVALARTRQRETPGISAACG
ncbi:MAG: cobyrinate a,c-diamide synthase [Acidobacteria bacterium]|jgi:cobyrinic acid a,c-diamide synthase|nr:cobyrinate a,c-diamide synthase [Acidobacteriota bacterium]